MIKILPGCSSNSDRIGAVTTPWTSLEQTTLLVKNLSLMSKFGSACLKSDHLGSQFMQNNQQWPGTQKSSVLPRKWPSLYNWRLKGRWCSWKSFGLTLWITNNLCWVPCFLSGASENLRIHPTSVFRILYYSILYIYSICYILISKATLSTHLWYVCVYHNCNKHKNSTIMFDHF